MDALTYNQLLNANLAAAAGLEYRVGTLIAHALFRSATTDAERRRWSARWWPPTRTRMGRSTASTSSPAAS
ncbi:hypothetical protein ACN28S_31735 [Cystobacter fuscus]